MIPRVLEKKLHELAGYYPAVAVSGPRQSGKTTLCRMAFPEKPYLSLESLDTRDFAVNDPRGFLSAYSNGAIFDEIQNAPGLLSYLQGDMDENPEPGRFILTGSQHFGLSQAISQSLAGRCGVLTLLPPDFQELRAFENAPRDLFTLMWQGSYPRIYDRGIPARQWLADYTATYIQRDVRQVVNVGDLNAFSGFLKLCAGRTGREINLSSMGSDAGISRNTARSWLSVLETSHIVHRLPAWHSNIRKQVARTPKLHFFDSGLACDLLGVREPDQLALHPLRGAIFESWVVSEIYKARVHRGLRPDMFHYREARGIEIDLLIEQGERLDALEMKSGATLSGSFFKNLSRFADRLKDGGRPREVRSAVVYGGDDSQTRSLGRALSWRDIRLISLNLP
ncbi:conserved hypothetical protein [Candidatus Desulfarcum epimagneticum]|uniref:AAA family ATPase n=1 Tax=uncultured Desulfobacteraceae bacterium TaxID=218296 RepID=A0A484HG26_9BACT|nr:conserved hypothetical protein [uncultured Desulfobacteraceae bacterium]